jgi:4-phytase/acid phosphatase/peptide/nickel transport system substrate-binding protein
MCLLVLALWSRDGRAEAARPAYGGTLTVGVDLEFRGFDPIKATYLQQGDRSVAMAVEERLFALDRKGNLVPELALSARPARDGRSWTVRLRKGVAFHDGTPFTADAVVRHWRRMLDPGNGFPGASLIEPVREVVRVDDHTVRFDLKHPWAAFRDVIAAAQWIGAYVPSPRAVEANTQDRAPVGTGPYVFREWLTNDRLVVVRNPGHWRKGRPYLDRVVFRPIPDMQARYAALQSGEVDVILTDRGASIVQAREDRALRVYADDSPGPYTFILNTARPPLDDARVRRALAYAWNQELLLKADYRGTLPLAKDPFGGTLACGDVGYRDYDPAKARRLLAEYGKPVELELLGTNTPRGREAGEIMQRLFKEVGVVLKLTPLATGQMVKRVMNGDYQLSGWRMMDYNDMGPYLYMTEHSQGRQNYNRYRNPRLDALLATAQESTDPAARTKALCGTARIINEEALHLYGGGRRVHFIAKAGIQGIAGVEEGVIRVSDVWLNGAVKKGM